MFVLDKNPEMCPPWFEVEWKHNEFGGNFARTDLARLCWYSTSPFKKRTRLALSYIPSGPLLFMLLENAPKRKTGISMRMLSTLTSRKMTPMIVKLFEEPAAQDNDRRFREGAHSYKDVLTWRSAENWGWTNLGSWNKKNELFELWKTEKRFGKWIVDFLNLWIMEILKIK